MTKSPSDTASPIDEKFNPDKLNENQASELRNYIDRLHPSAQADLLDKLRLLDSGTGDVAKNLWKTSLKAPVDPVLTTTNGDDADEDTAATYTRIMNAGGLRNISEAIPSHQMSSGFQLTVSSRDDKDIPTTCVILRKNERGADAIARKKTRDKVVQALKPEISAGNISRILTSSDEKEYDVASEAISWQTILKAIHRHCIQYDFISLLTIPRNVDLTQPLQVAKATKFLDAIIDWQQLEDNDYYEWQAFILKHGSAVELESDSWLEDTLLLSMDKTLRSEIESDISGFPKTCQGSITTLRLIMKRMVVKNQEARDALELYIKNFDITNFPGENVPMACLRLKAVATALGNDNLPINVIRIVLDGFAKSSTKSFNDVCSSQIAMRRTSLYKNILKNTSLHTQLIDVLNDLENSYLELIGGKKWDGVGHSGQNQYNSVFKNERNERLQKTLRGGMPWDEWVKQYARCDHCGEIGHIRPNCKKYLAKIESGEIKRPERGTSRDLLRKKESGPKKKNYLRDPKAKAFLSAFQALFSDDTDDEHEQSAPSNEAGDDKVEENDASTENDDIASFLSMVGDSLKE